MFERFTDRARRIMTLANQQAQNWNHEYIGIEHILLGLLKEGSGAEISVFEKYKIDTKKIKEEIEKSMKSGPDMVIMGKLPQSQSAQKAIEETINYALDHNFKFIESYHILAGLIRVESKASKVLIEAGLTEEKLTNGLEELLEDDLPGKIQKIDDNQIRKYWRIPKSKLDVEGFLKFYGFRFDSADLAITEKKPEIMSIYLSTSTSIGKIKRTSEEPLRYDKVELTPQSGSLPQLKEVVALKRVLDKNHVEYTSSPPIEEVIEGLREAGTSQHNKYKLIADSLEGKVE